MIRHLSLSRLRRHVPQAAACLLLLAVKSGAAPVAKPSPPPVMAYQPPAYYFTLQLDPRYQFIGVGALSPEDAAKANCYQFLYNSSGKLQQIEYRRAGVPMADPLLGVEKIAFEYQPGIERRWFHNAQNQPMRDVEGVQGEELTLNPAGFPTDVTNLDARGGRARDSSGVIHYLRTLDDHNRLVMGRRIGLFGTPITDDYGYYETRTVYDANGQAMQRGNYDSS